MKKKALIDRISFPTEYNNFKELRISVILLFITCLVFFITSSIAIIFNWFLFSKTLLLGTIAYELILFYLLKEYTKSFIEKKVKGKVKQPLSWSNKLIFGSLLLLTFATLVYTMLTPTPLTENKFISLLTSLFIITAPSFFWHELVTWFKKKGYKKLRLLGVALIFLLLTTNTARAQNDTLTTISEGVNSLEQGLNFINQVRTTINNVQLFIQENLNLTPQQTQIILLIAVLISAFMFLKFLGVIVKWVIVVLIAWIIIQLVLL